MCIGARACSAWRNRARGYGPAWLCSASSSAVARRAGASDEVARGHGGSARRDGVSGRAAVQVGTGAGVEQRAGEGGGEEREEGERRRKKEKDKGKEKERKRERKTERESVDGIHGGDRAPNEHARRSATRSTLRGTRERKRWDDD